MFSKLSYNDFMSTSGLSLVISLIFGRVGKFRFHFIGKSELLLLKDLKGGFILCSYFTAFCEKHFPRDILFHRIFLVGQDSQGSSSPTLK